MKKTIDLDAICILDGNNEYYGADQHWFVNKLHGMSGCGPTTAALITMYMAAVFSSCGPLYRYGLPARRDEFTAHMDEVRKFVRPGTMGLTDAGYFASSTSEFAESRGVVITSVRLPLGLTADEAFEKIRKAIDQRYVPALLILKNPSPDIDDFTWHWMAVTGYDDTDGCIFVSSYAKEYGLNFNKVWIQEKPYHADLVYFIPG